MSDTAWVIEHQSGLLCYGKVCHGDALGWVTFTDPDALRFPTKVEADNFIQHHCLTHLGYAREHQWG